MKKFIKENIPIVILLIFQIIFLVLKLTGVINWIWYWVLSPSWTLVAIFIAVVLVGLTRCIIEAVKVYHKSKLYRVSKLPKPIVDGFIKGYLENELENYPDRKDLN